MTGRPAPDQEAVAPPPLGTLARIAALQVALTVLFSLIAAPFGLTAMAAAYVARAYLTLPVQMRAFKRYSGIGYRPVLSAIAPALSMAPVMAGTLLALDHFIGDWFHNRGIFVLSMVVTGIAVYGVSLLLFVRNFVLEQVRDIKHLFPGPPAKPSGAGA